MEKATPTKRLAWAVLTKGSSTSTSEVIKVTGHEEADRTVQESPNKYYKSGPFLIA
tara:strand:- start:3432 stop:3599 length:168 start_codon:yes stop_codon:yes gene_type:complete